jgi:subtilisin family serine protease
MTRRLLHLLRITIVILCSALTIGGCDDPPEPVPVGGIILMMRTFATTADPDLSAIDHISLLTDHVEVVHADAAGNESHVTVDTANRLLTLSNRDQTQFLAQYPIPVGSVSQIRVFPKEVAITLKDGSNIQLVSNPQKPSFDQSGWKIVPEDGKAWPINDNLLTGVRALFHFDKKVLFNKGVGYKLKPTIPAEVFDVNPVEGAPGVFVDRIMVAFQVGVSRRQVDAFNAEIGATVLSAPNLTTAYIMKLPPTKNLEDAFTFYSAKSEVAGCAPAMNVEAHNVEPNEGIQDTQILAKIPAAWDHLASLSAGFGLGDRTLLIAVIDTGIDIAHPDIAFNIAINQGEIPPELGVVDVDGDGIITFVDLHHSANNSVRPFDTNGNGFVDGIDLLNDPKWANGIDEDANCGGLSPDPDNPGGKPCIDDLVGWNVFPETWSKDVTPDPTKLDKSSHGTFVAGIVGAEGNNGPGSQGFGIAGVLWRLQILPIRIDDPKGNGGTSSNQAILEGMSYASRMGAQIANISFGGILVSDAADTSCLKDLKGLLQQNAAGIPAAQFPSAIQSQAAIFRQPDLAPGGVVVTKTLFVMSSGNDTANLADPQVLAFAESAQTTLGKNVLIVGATESDEPTMANFSNYGAPVVEIFAPGTDWKSLKPWITGENCQPANDDDCVEYGIPFFRPQGTSFAAPLVAGVAGMALIAFPSLRGDPVALHDHLVRTATPVVSQTISCSPQQDQPLVNAHAVVTTNP